MDSTSFVKLALVSWNVRGLGDEDKCAVVSDNVLTARPSVLCLQETKLASVTPPPKLRSFLPPYLSEHAAVDASGSRGGVLTAWDPRVLALTTTTRNTYSISTSFQSTTSDTTFMITNVYAPSDHTFTDEFVAEMTSLLPLVSGPWIILGDFNLLRRPSDKNNANFNHSLAAKFNAMIHAMGLFELPLLDRLYTWTNSQTVPVLARLDRALFNHDWNAAFPDSALTTLPRPTSDHFPLLVTASTRIPCSSIFRFENSWLLDSSFLPATIDQWTRPVFRRNAAADLTAKAKRFRFAAKVWKREHRFSPFRENNCKFILSLFDFFEESRSLKFRAIREGDENSKFFHTRASQRFRRNAVRVLDVDGVQTIDHAGKARALLEFYTNLLGRARPTSWCFDLASLYVGAARAQSEALIRPFDIKEIRDAVFGMDRASAPGPDGLGPSFYRAAWEHVSPDLELLFHAFHAESVDLGCINRAHVALLPKTDGVLSPSSFRHVSLQNCSMKAICKALTARLQLQIGELIDENQSGFMQGRSISENFVYATEIVQCCHKRRAPSVVLKLDFAKAFDSIDWGSLRKVLEARGFPPKWCNWMDVVFHSSMSAILLNGIPGSWILCKRGLRQGDPLSPYLYLLMGDLLQRLFQQDEVLRHPLADDAQCPVLQYSDDTLIIFSASVEAAQRAKLLLDQFAQATGLVINFSKSTMVPMHVDPALTAAMQLELGCRVEGFLRRWCSLLLSAGGRIVLLNAVLDALPAYAMGAVALPPALLRAIDALWHAFLWNFEGRASGAKCLVASAQVCRPRSEGGLGVRDLSAQNVCLQVKLLHRLHSLPDSPRAGWAWRSINGPVSAGRRQDVDPHWSALEALIPMYRCISRPVIGDGRRTCFWLDDWLGEGALCHTMPALYSHALHPRASVADVIDSGLRAALVPRLTTIGERELACVSPLVAAVHLSGAADTRVLTHCRKKGGALDVGSLYRLNLFGGVDAPFAAFVWGGFAPSKAKFFAWLLVHSRMQSRSALLKKKILTEAEALCPICAAPRETATHIVFGCEFAARFWQHVGGAFPVDADVRQLHTYEAPRGIPETVASSFVILCWQIAPPSSGS
ncbi:unnamed protein product [Alopecurus aequalis]